MGVRSNFRAWLAQAVEGDDFVYHTGLLARDRERSPQVNGVADDAWTAAQQGLVVLYQKRLRVTSQVFGKALGEGCVYLVRRTGVPIPPLEVPHEAP